MEFIGTVEPEGTTSASWADEGQVAYYENEGDRVAEEVVAWGTTRKGSRLPLSCNVYGGEDALEVGLPRESLSRDGGLTEGTVTSDTSAGRDV